MNSVLIAVGGLLGAVGVLVLLTSVAWPGVRWMLRRRPAAQARRRSSMEAAEWEFAVLSQVIDAARADPVRLLAEPALADPDEQPTKALLDAYWSASVQHRQLKVDDPDQLDRFVDTVQLLRSRWQQAVQHASELGTTRLTPDQRAASHTARALLQQAALPSTTPAERAAGCSEARATLREHNVFVLPPRVFADLDGHIAAATAEIANS